MHAIAGVDEAGRGPLAGPVVAAAVILDPAAAIDGLADSKQLTAGVRDELFEAIRAKSAAFSVAEASVAEIDELNILQATMLAMRRAVLGLDLAPSQVLVDGNRCPQVPYPVRAIVKGDMVEPCISAASILAKVTRDRQLIALHEAYPEYGFAGHKGYPTRAHMHALARLGPTPAHRRTFGPVRRAVEALGRRTADD
ncbi:MAG: ribonuclease HII [Pseudomonadota bacterium]